MNSLRTVIASRLEWFPEKSSWFWNEQVCQGDMLSATVERYKGLDTALYKIINTFVFITLNYTCEFIGMIYLLF